MAKTARLHPWGDRSRIFIPEPTRTPSLRNIGISGDMYIDDGFGTYTGTPNQLLQRPTEWIHMLLRASAYGGESSFATGSNFGSFNNAALALDRWMEIGSPGGASSYEWSSTFENEDVLDLEDILSDIRDGLPEIIIPRTPAGQYRAFVWLPRYGTAGADWWEPEDLYSADPLNPVDLLVDGAKIISMGTSDVSEIINNISVEYDYDKGSGKYLRTASVKRERSDDGYESPWISWKSTGAGAADIANWSETEFGRRELRIQLPFIHNPRMAVACGWYLLARFYRPTVRIQFSASPEVLDMQPGHIFRWGNELESVFRYPPPFWGTAAGGAVEGASWESIYWLVQHAEIETDGGRGGYLICTAEWYPQYIGSEAGFGIGSFGGESGVIGEPTTEIGEVIGA